MRSVCEKLVSIITPCYNTGHLVNRLLDSILEQDYPFIELFIIDDGSTDNLSQIINTYVDKFNAKGYAFKYKHQENSGQSVAINNALKWVNGEYLLWPDSDDYYIRKDAISLMVAAMEKHRNFPMMRAYGNIVDEISGKVIKVLGENNPMVFHNNSFEDCLFTRNNYYYQPICYILRLQSLKQATKFPIYTSKSAGQNWQLMLPVLYGNDLGIIEEIICNILERNSSHSRSMKLNYEKEIAGKRTYRDTILGTLDRIIVMNDSERKKYINQINEFYLRKELEIDYSYNCYDSFLKKFALFKQKYPSSVNTRMTFWYILMLTRTSKALRFVKNFFSIIF